MLAAPPCQPISAYNTHIVANGGSLLTSAGCEKCHTAALLSLQGDAKLCSGQLLHDILAAGVPGIEDGLVTQSQFRTASLWALSQMAPRRRSVGRLRCLLGSVTGRS